MEGVEVFYHIGEIMNISRSASLKNVRLMEAITGHADACGVKRIVFISSISVAGIPSRIPADEETEPSVLLNDFYTSYKRRCEELLKESLTGCEYSVIRPAVIYGPGSRRLGRLIDAVEKIGPAGFPFAGNAENIAPLINVKDLARAIYLAGIIPEASGQTMNLTDGLSHTWRDFFGAIAGRLGKRLRVLPVPPLFLKLGAFPLGLFLSAFGMELDAVSYVNYFSRDIFFENTMARRLLHWQPEYSLEEGVREMVEYYRGA
jgi:UDP-glucose 4-epimerase